MNTKKTIKKILALGAGVTMVGATIMGATAYNLADYPTPYIEDGVFSGKIVVGERAATQDVLGAIDIAASLQAESVTQEAVEIPGQAGEVQLEGDAFKIATSSDLLEIREAVGAVYDTLTSSDLEALQGGTIVTDEGSTDYYQYVRFGDSTTNTALQQIGVNYIEDENDVLGDFLVVDDDSPFMEWELEFTEGLESERVSGELEDLEDEVINIFGTDFTIVDTSVTSSNAVTLTLMAGDVSSTMREGETKTFTIDGVEYEVSLIFVSDPSSGSSNPEAKFMVNGEVTDSMQDGDTDTLSGGVQIGVRDLLVNSREGVVEFFLGANKVEFTDATTGSESFDGDVEINNENIEDADLSILAGNVSSTKFEILNIQYRLTADADIGSTIYVPSGSGVREYLDEPEGLLSPSFDIRYEGLSDVMSTEVAIDSQSDHSYEARLTNLRGKEYNFPLLTNQDGTFYWGDDDDDFFFTEPTVSTTGGSVLLNLSLNNSGNTTDFWIGDDDYFLLSEGSDGSISEKDDSAVLRYEDIDTSDRVISFTDLNNGEQREVSYTTDTTNVDVLGVATNFVVEGNTYSVWIGNNSQYPLAIDLNGDGALNGAQTTFTVRGGGVVDFDDNGQSGITLTGGVPTRAAVGATSVAMALNTTANQFDDSQLGGDSFTWTITNETSSEVDLSAGTYTGPLVNNTDGFEYSEFSLINDDSDDDYDRAMTDYGALIEVYDPSGSNDAGELTITFPEVQRGGQVFVVAGTTSRTDGPAGLTRDVVNPISVGLAVLDVDAPPVGSENLIVVGGPCANTVAAELMENPANCAAGFSAGMALIKSFEDNGQVSILVAGYEAQETLGASYVLANYGDYALEGEEVEVVVPNLNDLTVQTVSTTLAEDVAQNTEDIDELEDDAMEENE